MGNGAFEETMGIFERAIGDTSHDAPPYRTTGEIITNDAGDVLNVYVKGILVDFEVKIYNMNPFNTGNYSTQSISSEEDPVFP